MTPFLNATPITCLYYSSYFTVIMYLIKHPTFPGTEESKIIKIRTKKQGMILCTQLVLILDQLDSYRKEITLSEERLAVDNDTNKRFC